MMTALSALRGTFRATGVGSLPHHQVAASVDCVVTSLPPPHIPFWPQVPSASFLENMYVQYTEKFPGICVNSLDKTVFVNTQGPSYVEQVEACFHKCLDQDVSHFAISPAYAQGLYALAQTLSQRNAPAGWVKAQIIGPVSLGLTLLDEAKTPILYNPELAELVPLFLAMKAAWLVDFLTTSLRPAGVIVVVDEPYLVALGTAQCTLARQDILAKINHVLDILRARGAVAGLHCCGNTDWELVMEARLDLLNFDAAGYLKNVLLYEKALDGFIRRGGMLAIGAVSNVASDLVAGYEDKIVDELKKYPFLWSSGALITSSCGLSGLTPELARKALGVCVAVAQRLERDSRI